jgi:hypothetical protein
MNTWRIVCVVGIAGMGICGFASDVFWQEIVAEVNRQLPAQDRFGESWWYLDKSQRLLREHRRLFPVSRLRRRLWGSGLILGLSGLMAGIALFSQVGDELEMN